MVAPPAGVAKESRSEPAAGGAAETTRGDVRARVQPPEFGLLQAAVPAVKDEKTIDVTAGPSARGVAESADRVLEFARAALQNSDAAARARYAGLAEDDFAAIPAADADLLRAWNAGATHVRGGRTAFEQVTVPLTAVGKAKVQNEVAPDPARLNVAEPVPPVPLNVAEPMPPVPPPAAQLRILDALVWPRRDQAGARQDVAALAQAWQPYVAADAYARERVGVLAAWLAETSPTDDEKARWEAVRSAAQQR